MTDQVRKAENSETLPKKRFQGTTFENIFFDFLRMLSLREIREKQKYEKTTTKKYSFRIETIIRLEHGINLV